MCYVKYVNEGETAVMYDGRNVFIRLGGSGPLMHVHHTWESLPVQTSTDMYSLIHESLETGCRGNVNYCLLGANEFMCSLSCGCVVSLYLFAQF